MGMCAIYTALPATTAHDAIVRGVAEPEVVQIGFGRHAILEMVAAYVPASHAALAARVRERTLWGLVTVRAARSTDPSISRLAQLFELPDFPIPIWPSTPALAAIVGTEPAQLLHDAEIAWLDRDALRAATDALATPARPFVSADTAAWVADLRDWFERALSRGDGVALHWAYR